jgi:NRPS condensation-like uncharacterized protein
MNNDNPIEDIYPLTQLQQGMMFHILYAPDSRAYFHQYLGTLEDDLNLPAFKKARQQVVDRHPILRSAFEWESWTSPFRLCSGE